MTSAKLEPESPSGGPAKWMVTRQGRVLFRLNQAGGDLVGCKAKAPRQERCEFASGTALDAAFEDVVFAAAAAAKSWDSFVFKLKLEGCTLRPEHHVVLPIGKL